MKKKQNIIDIEWVVDHRSDGFYIRKTEEFVFSSDYKVHLQENGQNIDVMFTYRNAVGKMNGDFSITIARCTNRAEARNAAMEFLKTFKTADRKSVV